MSSLFKIVVKSEASSWNKYKSFTLFMLTQGWLHAILLMELTSQSKVELFSVNSFISFLRSLRFKWSFDGPLGVSCAINQVICSTSFSIAIVKMKSPKSKLISASNTQVQLLRLLRHTFPSILAERIVREEYGMVLYYIHRDMGIWLQLPQLAPRCSVNFHLD